jgi:NAD(P) transhydrogenase subunit beta
MGNYILEISYIIASVLFILGLKMLSSPDSARKGNLWAAFGMGLAILTTILFHTKNGQPIGNFAWIFGGLIIGTAIGWYMAVKVKMTDMPQMVSFFNGMGGACAAVISLIEFPHIDPAHGMLTGEVLSILAGLMIGTVSFTGSMVAFGKLDGRINDIRVPWLTYFNMALLISLFVIGGFIMAQPEPNATLLYVMAAVAAIYGISFVMPIGGADMPVVISLLNSFTGVAAACGGFLYDNQAMLTGGILVGSAGTILTILMCKAMNRSLGNVILGAFGGNAGGGGGDRGDMGNVKESTPTDAAILLAYANKVVIVPGYGLAVAQAQHACHELEKTLTAKGVNVIYGVHPVAGRMPGHMNVLLAEADVDYNKLLDLEDVNGQIAQSEVALIVGANDVVNPAAETDKSSPIYGMPIIQAHKAKNVFILKRSMKPGYAGIENELFFADNTRMVFGDARDTIEKLNSEVKNI